MIQQYINIRQAGGSVAVAVSDTTPDFGDTITITATATGFVASQYQFLLFNGSVALLAQQAGNTLNWTVNVGAGNYDIYVLATDGSINGFGLESIVVTVLYQTETIAYMTAVGIPADGTLYYPATVYERTGLQLWQAIDTFVISIKSVGWSKFKAIWPRIGGTADRHKWNLINPVDSDAAHRNQFFGGWTHGATGALPNGGNAYINLHISPIQWTTTNVTHGQYLRNQISPGLRVAFGVNDGGLIYIYPNFGDGNGYHRYGASELTRTPVNTQGFVTYTQRLSTFEIRKNGVLSSTGGNVPTAPLQSISINLFSSARNNSGTAIAFADAENTGEFLADGLISSEITSIYNAFQTLQTALNRQV